MPAPDRGTTRLPPALSLAMVKEPLRKPSAVGVNVSIMLQLAPAASELPQPFACSKSPLTEIPERCSVAPPVLLNVIGCAALAVFSSCAPKTNAVGVALAKGSTPVPDRLTTGAVPLVLLETVRLPVRVPRAVGVNETLMAQPAPGARLEPHVFV